MSDDNVINVDFGGRTSESRYYEVQADEPYDPVFVAVHEAGIELIQEDGAEAHEVFLTDEQLASVLLIIGIEERRNNPESSEGETIQ